MKHKAETSGCCGVREESLVSAAVVWKVPAAAFIEFVNATTALAQFPGKMGS